MDGVVRTRVGYAGGTVENPTYHNLGLHSETIQIDYDPQKISYAELLRVFWDGHQPTGRSYARQYMSIIFYHNEEQRKMAVESKKKYEDKQGQVYTEITLFVSFALAEDYHQKYNLRRIKKLNQALESIYPDPLDLVNSAAAAKINGYLAQYGDRDSLNRILPGLGLTEEESQVLLQRVKR